MKKIALSAMAVLLVLLTAEIVLRLREPDASSHSDDRREPFIRPSTNKLRKYEGIPNGQGRFWGADIRLNDYGFRGRAYDVKKPDGVYRVAVLGDSITFGNDLREEDIYAYRLEELCAADDLPVEVINMGLSGYDTLQEVSTLEEIGCKFGPDMVVVAYCMNDMVLASLNLKYIRRIQQRTPSPRGSRLAHWLQNRFDRIELNHEGAKADSEQAFRKNNRQYISDVRDDDELMGLISQIKQRVPAKGKGHRTVSAYTSERRLGKLRYSLEKLQGLQNEYGFDVILAIVPYLNETPENRTAYSLTYAIVAHEADRLGFEVLDLRNAFADAGFESLRMKNRNIIHPNSRGHSIMAKELYGQIQPHVATNKGND